MKAAWSMGELRKVLRNLMPALNLSCVSLVNSLVLGRFLRLN